MKSSTIVNLESSCVSFLNSATLHILLNALFDTTLASKRWSAINMPKFRCPRCQQLNQESDDQVGTVILCRGCQQKLRVPSQKSDLLRDGEQRRSAVVAPNNNSQASGHAELNDVPTLELDSEPAKCSESGAATYGLASSPEEWGRSTHTACQLSDLAREVIEEFDILVGNTTLSRPKPNDESTPEPSNQLASFGKGMGTALLLRGFIGPLGDVVGAMVATSSDTRKVSPQETYTPAEWKKQCQKDAESNLQSRGFPTRPIQRLGMLISAIKYQEANSLINILKTESDVDARRGAIVALGYLGTGAAPAIPLLCEALHDRNEEVCKRAIVTLGRIGSPVKPIVPELLDLLLQSDSQLPARETITLIKDLESLTERALPAVVQSLCDDDVQRRKRALAIFLVLQTRTVSPMGPLLAQAINKVSSEKRPAIIQALQYADPKLARQNMMFGERLRSNAGALGCGAVLVLVLVIGLAVIAISGGTIHFVPPPNSAPSPPAQVVTSGLVSETELAEFLPWTPPEGWKRGEASARTGLLGGKFLTFHMTSSAFPSIDVKCDFKRESSSEAELVARLKRTTSTANAVGGKLQWLPTRSLGRRTVYVIDGPNNDTTSLRQYRWLISERSIDCAVAISGDPTRLAAALAAIEPSLEAAIVGHDPSNVAPTPEANAPTPEANLSPTQTDGESKMDENKPRSTSDSPPSDTEPRDADVSPMTAPPTSDSPKIES